MKDGLDRNSEKLLYLCNIYQTSLKICSIQPMPIMVKNKAYLDIVYRDNHDEYKRAEDQIRQMDAWPTECRCIFSEDEIETIKELVETSSLLSATCDKEAPLREDYGRLDIYLTPMFGILNVDYMSLFIQWVRCNKSVDEKIINNVLKELDWLLGKYGKEYERLIRFRDTLSINLPERARNVLKLMQEHSSVEVELARTNSLIADTANIADKLYSEFSERHGKLMHNI